MNNSIRRVGVVSFVLVVLSFGAISRAAREDAAEGRTITYTGYLEQGGSPVNETRELSFRLFESRTGGTPIWNGTLMVPVSAGRFVVELGGDDMPSLPSSVFSIPELWLQVSVGGVALGDRQRVGTSRHASNGSPAGSVTAFAGDAATVPDGWLLCDGRALDGDDPRYLALRRAIGTAWGNGTSGPGASASTNFNVPDLRGRFLRGVDAGAGRDPDVGSRTQPAPGGSVGNQVGSVQTDSLRNHSHPVQANSVSPGGGGGVYWGLAENNLNRGLFVLGEVAGIYIRDSGGGAETRPANAYMNYIIKI